MTRWADIKREVHRLLETTAERASAVLHSFAGVGAVGAGVVTPVSAPVRPQDAFLYEATVTLGTASSSGDVIIELQDSSSNVLYTITVPEGETTVTESPGEDAVLPALEALVAEVTQAGTGAATIDVVVESRIDVTTADLEA